MTKFAPETEGRRVRRWLSRWGVSAVAILVVEVIVLYCLYVLAALLFIFVPRPVTVLEEQHYDPDFTLVIRETQFRGRVLTIHTGSRWLFGRRSKVVSVYAGDPAETPSIASATLGFEWHDDRKLVALRGSASVAADEPSLYIALLSFDDEGRVWEVPLGFDPSTIDGGDNGGYRARARIHEAIEQILDKGSQ